MLTINPQWIADHSSEQFHYTTEHMDNVIVDLAAWSQTMRHEDRDGDGKVSEALHLLLNDDEASLFLKRWVVLSEDKAIQTEMDVRHFKREESESLDKFRHRCIMAYVQWTIDDWSAFADE